MAIWLNCWMIEDKEHRDMLKTIYTFIKKSIISYNNCKLILACVFTP
jgi:hypothetical protein